MTTAPQGHAPETQETRMSVTGTGATVWL
ncbi:MAG: hypothetical protein QOI83_4761, partial [Streptomycetaceae bacterium]|nr:hypothetical protein [Streptomycetaceae bacterium]